MVDKKAFIEFDRKENILIEIRRFGSPEIVMLKASIASHGGYLQYVILSKSILIVNSSKI